MTPFNSLIAVTALGLIHLFAARMRFLDRTPRSAWLSAAGGVSVAYVFVHLLPDLSDAQKTIAATLDGALGQLETHVYLVALAGLVIFYGLERVAVTSRRRQRDAEKQDAPSPESSGSMPVRSPPTTLLSGT